MPVHRPEVGIQQRALQVKGSGKPGVNRDKKSMDMTARNSRSQQQDREDRAHYGRGYRQDRQR